MPMLRWFGFSRVTSLPSITDRARGRLLEAGDHAQHRRLAAAGRPEEGDELAALDVEVEVLHDGASGRRTSCDVLDREERIGHGLGSLGQFGRLADFGAKRDRIWISRHAGPGDGEGDDRERRRLVGAVGADDLQVGPEGRPVEQARHGELADDDGEGQEGAGQHRDQHVGQDDAGDDRRPAGAEALRRLGQRAHVDGAQAGVDRAVHVGQRQRHVAEDEQQVGAARACR